MFDGSEGSYAGASLSSAGDVDLDGFDDILIGASRISVSAYKSGSVFLFRGPVSGTVDLEFVEPMFSGPVSGDLVGWSAAGLGDTDADGLPDILIGGIGDDDGGDDAGAAWLIGGASL